MEETESVPGSKWEALEEMAVELGGFSALSEAFSRTMRDVKAPPNLPIDLGNLGVPNPRKRPETGRDGE